MVKWTHEAVRDLKEIHCFIANDSKFYAKKVVDDIKDKVRMLSLHPNIGRMIPELERTDFREVCLYSYRILYHIDGATIIILRFIHGKMLLPMNRFE